jgi:hypothetical protein
MLLRFTYPIHKDAHYNLSQLYYNPILDGIWEEELKLQWHDCEQLVPIKDTLKRLVGELAEHNKTMRTFLANDTILCDGLQVRIYLQIDIVGKPESNPRPMTTICTCCNK